MTSISDVVERTTTFHEPVLCGKTLTIKVAILRPSTQGPCAGASCLLDEQVRIVPPDVYDLYPTILLSSCMLQLV